MTEFVEKRKSFPIKPNDWAKKTIKETHLMVQDLEKIIPLLTNGCCGGGK